MAELDPIDYIAEPTPAKFHARDTFVRGIMGPYGCVAGDTLVLTEQGPLPISEIDRPMRVLSWDEKSSRFVLAPSSGAYRKQTGDLYRISTRSGCIDVAGNHRMLCADGEYRYAHYLNPSDELAECSIAQQQTSEGASRLLSTLDVRRCSQIALNCLGSYADEARRCDPRLLPEVGNGRSCPPSPADAPIGSYSFSHEGGRQALSPGRILRNLSACRASKKANPDQSVGSRAFFAEGSSAGPCLQHNPYCMGSLSDQTSVVESRERNGVHHLTQSANSAVLEYPCSSEAFSSSNLLNGVNSHIIDIEVIHGKFHHWDMQVLDTNNYVTVDGTIHHNSGKSVACTMEVISRAQRQEPNRQGIRKSRWAVIRNSYPELLSTTIKTWKDWVVEGVIGNTKMNPPIQSMVKFPMGDGTSVDLEVIFLALDREADTKKLLSLELTGAWVNEAREIGYGIIEALTGRIGRYPSIKDGGPSWSGIIMDTNPPDDDHWWYRLAEVEKPEGYEFFKQPGALIKDPKTGRYKPNPLAENVHNLKIGFEYYMRMVPGKRAEWLKVYVEGLYGTVYDGRPVYPEFNDILHVSSEIEPMRGRAMILAFDFGLTPACAFIQQTPRGQLLVLDELYVEDLGIRSFLEQVVKPHVQEHYQGMAIIPYGDPAGVQKAQTDERSCFDIMAECGMPCEPAPSNNPVPRQEAVSYFLTRMVDGEPGFLMHPRCNILRKGFNGGYRFRRIAIVGTAESRLKDAPEKNRFSHIHDALQYGALSIKELGGCANTMRAQVRPVKTLSSKGWT